MRFLLLLMLLAAPRAAAAAAVEDARLDPAALKPVLRNISDWIVGATSLPTNNLTNTSDTLATSIFINGNLARVLLAASRIFADDDPAAAAAYRTTGLAWCDTLVALQHDADTHDGRPGAAGWWDTGYSDLYIADTGTAVTCLALCHDVAPQPRYMRAMLKFAEFVVNGTNATPKCTFTPHCDYDPQGNDTETTATWLVGDGSLGDGYYKGSLNRPSYTIATATTGGAFFAEMHALLGGGGGGAGGGRTDFGEMAGAASAWLVRHVQANGTIPYYIWPPTNVPHEYQCISYSAEAIVDADLRGLLDPAKVDVLGPAKRMVGYLLAQQTAAGELLDPAVASVGEQQRSPRAMSVLQWYAAKTGDPAARAALGKYAAFLQRHAFGAYGVNRYALVTGFVGLGLADLIRPWVTFVGGLQQTEE
jgi:hypothetical protein